MSKSESEAKTSNPTKLTSDPTSPSPCSDWEHLLSTPSEHGSKSEEDGERQASPLSAKDLDATVDQLRKMVTMMYVTIESAKVLNPEYQQAQSIKGAHEGQMQSGRGTDAGLGVHTSKEETRQVKAQLDLLQARYDVMQAQLEAASIREKTQAQSMKLLETTFEQKMQEMESTMRQKIKEATQMQEQAALIREKTQVESVRLLEVSFEKKVQEAKSDLQLKIKEATQECEDDMDNRIEDVEENLRDDMSERFAETKKTLQDRINEAIQKQEEAASIREKTQVESVRLLEASFEKKAQDAESSMQSKINETIQAFQESMKNDIKTVEEKLRVGFGEVAKEAKAQRDRISEAAQAFQKATQSTIKLAEGLRAEHKEAIAKMLEKNESLTAKVQLFEDEVHAWQKCNEAKLEAFEAGDKTSRSELCVSMASVEETLQYRSTRTDQRLDRLDKRCGAVEVRLAAGTIDQQVRKECSERASALQKSIENSSVLRNQALEKRLDEQIAQIKEDFMSKLMSNDSKDVQSGQSTA